MILRDFALYLIMVLSSFLILALVFTFFELLTDIVRNKVPVIMLAEYLLNLSPSLLYLMAPVAVLLAVLITFGLLEKSSELTAMKATGISIYRAALPVIVVCAVFAGAMFIFDQLYIPHTNKEQEILRNQIKGKPPQTYLQADRKWIFGQNNDIYYYQVFDPDTNQLGGVSIFEFDPNTFQLTRRIYAAHAHWGESLNKWIFEQGWVRNLSGTSIQDYRTFDVATFNDLREDPGYFKKEVKQSSEMNYEELERYIRDLEQSGFDTVRLKVQLQKKLAFPLDHFGDGDTGGSLRRVGPQRRSAGWSRDRSRHRRGVLGHRGLVRGHGQCQSTACHVGRLGARLYFRPCRRVLPVAGTDVKQLSAVSYRAHRIRIRGCASNALKRSAKWTAEC